MKRTRTAGPASPTLVAALAWLGACGGSNPAMMQPTLDANGPTDAAADTSTDVATDAPSDAATDAATDAAVDAGAPRVVRVAGGSFAHTCAALSTGAVRCWGVNDRGQLGIAPGDSRQQCRVPDSSPAENLPCEQTPRDVAGLAAVVDVAVGNGGTCALTRDGAVWCWGNNDAGELGQGTSDPSATTHAAPVRVTLPPARQVAYGAFHVCAVLMDGAVQCWGSNKFGQCGVAPAMSDAQCDPGDGITAGCMLRPRAVAGLSGVRQVSLGRNHSCALLDDGTVRCWGLNQAAQLGNGMVEADTSPRPSPTAVAGLANVTQIAAGGSHTCALRADGAVLCWGWNDLGQLGTAPTTDCRVGTSDTFRCAMSPVQVPELSGVRHVAAGRWHTCATLAAGGARCAGRNDDNQLGLGAPGADRCTSFPDTFPCTRTFGDVGTASAQEVTVGNYHSCAVMADGTARCWGAGYYGQIGNGGTMSQSRPVAVSNLP